MAPTPSTIPTSFVPKQPVRSGGRYEKSGSDLFLIVSLIILGLSLLGVAGVFGYQQFLTSVKEAKSKQVTEAQLEVDSASVESFIRLRTRFSSAEAILNERVAATGFFEVLERLTLQTVRFDSLRYSVLEDGSGEIAMAGTARTFNALAAQSAEFAKEKRVKSAIFSDISVSKETGAVTFSLTADLDRELLLLSADRMPAPAGEAPAADVEPADATGAPATTTPL